MTDQEINIAIAEACGKLEPREGTVVYRRCDTKTSCFQRIRTPDGGESPSYRDYDDYCSDLNAMHEAEVNPELSFSLDDYPYWLRKVTGESEPISATARQRAEAFLRTLNKWKEANEQRLP